MVFFDDNPVSFLIFRVDELFGGVYFADVAVLLDYSEACRTLSQDVEHYLEQIVQIFYGTRVCDIG